MAGRRRVWGGVALAFVCGLVGASAAWACTATTIIRMAPVESALPGTELAVQVYAPTVETGPVQLRLVDAPVGTAPLATSFLTKGQQLSIPMAVPDLTPGVHYVGLVSQEKFVARAAFEVLSTAKPERAAPPEASQPPSPGTHGGTALPLAVTTATAGVASLLALGTVVTRRRRARAELPA